MAKPTDRKIKIAKIAAKLIKEKGYLSLSFKELRKEADIAAGTLYRTFTSKDDLLLFIFNSMRTAANESLMLFEKQELTARERLVCRHCFESYLRVHRKDSAAIDLIGMNKAVFKDASPETRAVFEQRFSQVKERQLAYLERLVEEGKMSASKEVIIRVIKQLAVVTKGGVTIANHALVTNKAINIDDLIELFNLVLGQLDWIGAEGNSDPRKIKTAMRTVFDKTQSQHW